jgi:hypothetical protein
MKIYRERDFLRPFPDAPKIQNGGNICLSCCLLPAILSRHLNRKVRFTGGKILPFLVIHPQEELKFPIGNIGSALFSGGYRNQFVFSFLTISIWA